MPKDLDVYAELLKRYNDFGYRNLNMAHIYVFSQEIRNQIANGLKMSQYQFNNSISRMRKIGMIEKNGLSPNYILRFDKKLEIHFNDGSK